MKKAGLKKFLDEKKGYAKFGSAKLMQVLQDKGHSLVNLTQDDVKEVLRQKAAGYVPANQTPKATLKVLFYDIETTFVEARVWSSGKQYVGHNAITTETQIITVAYKWADSNDVKVIKWDRKSKSDMKLMNKFVKIYNKADMVVGFNNNSFDNKIVHSRAMKHSLQINTLVKSFDIMRQVKRVFRLPSYSMAYIAKYLGLQGKLTHSGIQMWEDIQWGNKASYKASMKLMVLYNIQDVALTEEIYYKLRQYLGNVIHAGAVLGKVGITCPSCGSSDIKLDHTTTTPAGTIQRVMICNKDKVKFKITNSAYLKSL
jgi:uncharacterized protein YprB with RNaseH-like and TPR domain